MVALAAAIGAVVGALRARRREGNRLDMAQWAAIHAILFALLALVALIAIDRLG